MFEYGFLNNIIGLAMDYNNITFIYILLQKMKKSH